MLKRKILSELEEWKKQDKKKSLLVLGTRQVGKSYIIKVFAEANYQSNRLVYINFEENPNEKAFFEGDLNPEAIIQKMKLYRKYQDTNFDYTLPDNPFLFIFDEIQACPNAITALKFFTESGKYHVIGTGSLLGISLNRISSFPVGYVDIKMMYPLDFEEFLWANGYHHTEALSTFLDSKPITPSPVHEQLLSYFRQFIIIGGMPEAVHSFVTNEPFANVLKIQRQIIASYRMDIAKYGDARTKEKTRDCFDSIPFQLAKDNKKFQYRYIGKEGGRSRDFDGSLSWLKDSGLVHFCYNITRLEAPLEGYKIPNQFKIYMCDSGLLVAMLDDGAGEAIISGNLGIYKGAIYENAVANCLVDNGHKLFYYEKNNKLEIDFVIRTNDTIVPIEVKSGDNSMSKSLAAVMGENTLSYGIKLSSKNQGFDEEKRIRSLPIYLLAFIK